jgi:hypothetical protein
MGPIDEPTFTLRGSDPIAPAAVRLWAAQYWQQGGDLERVAEARAIADAMEVWQKKCAAARRSGSDGVTP